MAKTKNMHSRMKFLLATLILSLNIKYTFSYTLYGEKKKDDFKKSSSILHQVDRMHETENKLNADESIFPDTRSIKENPKSNIYQNFFRNFTENEKLIQKKTKSEPIYDMSVMMKSMNLTELKDRKWKIKKRCFCQGSSLMHHICEAHEKMHSFGHHAHDVMNHFGEQAHDTMHRFGEHAHEQKENFGHHAHERLSEFGHEAHNTKAHFGCDQHKVLDRWHQCGCVKKSKLLKTANSFTGRKKSFVNHFCRDGRCNNNYERDQDEPFENYNNIENRDNYFNTNQANDERLNNEQEKFNHNRNEQRNTDNNIFVDHKFLENAAFGQNSHEKYNKFGSEAEDVTREHQESNNINNFEGSKHRKKGGPYDQENYNKLGYEHERKDGSENHRNKYREGKHYSKQFPDDEIDQYSMPESKNKDYIGNEDYKSRFDDENPEKNFEEDTHESSDYIGDEANQENFGGREHGKLDSFGENAHTNKANFGENSHKKRKHFGEKEHENKKYFGENEHANKEHFGEEEHNSRAHFGEKEHENRERFGENENEFKNHFGEKAHETQSHFGQQEHKNKEEFGKTAHENQAHFGREAHSSKEHFGEEEHENKENFGREAHKSRKHFGESQHENMEHFGDRAHKNLESFYSESKKQHKNKEHFGEEEHNNKKHFGEDAHKTMGMFGKSAHQKMKNFGLQAHKNLALFGLKDFQGFLNTRNKITKSKKLNKPESIKNISKCIGSKCDTRTYHDEPGSDEDEEEYADERDEHEDEDEHENEEDEISSRKEHENNAKERMEHFGEHAHEHKEEFGKEQHERLANFEHISRDHREKEAKKQWEHFGEQQHEKKKHFGEGDPEYHSRCAHDKLKNFGKFAHRHQYGCSIDFGQYRNKIETQSNFFGEQKQQKSYYRRYKTKLWPENPQAFKKEKYENLKNKTNSNNEIFNSTNIEQKIPENKYDTNENKVVEHSIICDFCENGALCVTEPEPIKFTCYCTYNYEGSRCEIYSPQSTACNQNTCYNGGRCEERPSKKEKFHCFCKSGWHGQQCTEKDTMDWSKW